MCESGRVVHHLRNNVENEHNTILIVGYQAQHTLGRRIVERRPKVRILGVERELHARVVVMNAFSAHGDKNDLHQYVARAKGRVAFSWCTASPSSRSRWPRRWRKRASR